MTAPLFTHSLQVTARMLFSIAAIAFVVFFLIRAIPGDITDLYVASGDLSAGQQARMRSELGLDAGVFEQFQIWSAQAMRGDLGKSLRFHTPVAAMLLDALPHTLTLTGGALLLGLVLGGLIALLACAFPAGPWRRCVELLNVWSIAMPSFCIGIIAVLVFSIWLQWLPIRGQLLMPIIILGLDVAGQVAKPLYEELMDITRRGFVRTARAKGLSGWKIVQRHVLPNAVAVVISLAGIIFGSLIGGTLTMEVVFGLNGVGGLTFTAIQGRDYPLVQAGITWLAISVVIINQLARMVSVWVDPRLRSIE
ncbi:ABC transporter permease [Alcaligenaceae bacterium]|nr:ABC transporter permease [Alcaligenaceae bacterium]